MTPEEIEDFIARSFPEPPQAPNMVTVAVDSATHGHVEAITIAVKQLAAWIDYRAFCECVRELGKDW